MRSLTGTGALVRLILRRDRVLMPIWMFFMSVLPLSLASGTASIYTTDEARAGYIRDLGSSPLLLMFYGRRPGPDLGALIFWRSATGMVIMALIGLLIVIRHTRVEEEAGRRELIGSTVVGRHAPLAAALVAVSGAALVVGVLVALGMMSQDTPASGSFAMGLAWASAAILFACVGAVTAQLSEGAGPARGIAIGVLGVAFLLRGIGDISDSALSRLSWLSPLGWPYEVRAYGENRWWVFGLIAVFVIALGCLAFALSARRDVGAGLLAPRLGPAQASAGLRSPLALAWRLHRGAFYAWGSGMIVYGLLIGGVAKTTSDLLANNKQLLEVMERMGGKSAASDIFIAGCMGLAGIIVSGYAIAAALKMRTEEASLRTEPLLATAVSRVQWSVSHLAFALLGPTFALVLAGLAGGLMHGLNTGDVGRELPRVLAGALVQIPAGWLLAALTAAVFGLAPRLAPAVGWTALGFCVFLGQIGAALQLGQPFLDLSPFTHIPRVPGSSIAATPLLALTALTAALITVGLASFRRRDIPIT